MKKKSTVPASLTYSTTVATLEQRLGVDLHSPKDQQLGEFLKQQGYPNAAKLLQG